MLRTYQGTLPTSAGNQTALVEGGASVYIDNDNNKLYVNDTSIGLSQSVTTTDYGYSATSGGYTMQFIMTAGHLTNIFSIAPEV